MQSRHQQNLYKANLYWIYIEAKDLRHKTECNSKPFFSVAARKSYLIFAIYVRLYVCICMALGDSLYRYATYKSAPKTRIWRAEVKFWKHIGIGMTEVHNLTAAVGWRTMDWTWLLILVLGISTWFLLHFFSSIFHLLTRVQLSPGIEGQATDEVLLHFGPGQGNVYLMPGDIWHSNGEQKTKRSWFSHNSTDINSVYLDDFTWRGTEKQTALKLWPATCFSLVNI